MAILQMQRLNLVAMKQNRKAVLERLQDIGAVEIDVELDDKAEGVFLMDTSESRSVFERRCAMADQAIGILDRYAPEKTSMLSMLEGKPMVEESEYDETVRQQQEYMKQANRLIALEKEIAEANSSIQKLENAAEALTPWLGMDIPMNSTGTSRTALIIGTLPEPAAKDAVLSILKEYETPVEDADVEVFYTDKDMSCLCVICLCEYAQAAEEALRAKGFARLSATSDRTPEDEKKAIAEQIEGLRAQAEKLIADVAAMSNFRYKLKLLSDYYMVRADKYGVLGTLPQTANTFALSGYVPARIAPRLKAELEEKYGADVELETVGPKERAPVILKNNPFSNCVDGVVSSYGLPGKGEIDPTVVVSIFYVVLFGMMLSDAGYGLVIAIGCAFALLKFKNMEESLAKTLKMFFFCGCSTIVWGILFGGFFGDVIQVVSREFFGHEVTVNALWFTPINEPMRLLIYSLIIGIVHMFIGFGIKGGLLLREKKYVAFISDVVAWYLFLVGLLLLLIPSSIFASMAGATVTFGPGLTYFSYVITVVGAVILLIMAGRRKKKKIGIRLLLGIYEIYGITSWLSDWLSYSRLLALGLATGAIAQVVNMVGSMFGHGVLQIAIFVVVFIIGHILNMAINVLGAYVHTNRLQYVEFFQKFYEGEGRPFEPFKSVTKYVRFMHGSKAA